MFCCWVIMETKRFGNSLSGHGLIGGLSVQYFRRGTAAEKRRETTSGWKRVAFTRERNMVAVFERRNPNRREGIYFVGRTKAMILIFCPSLFKTGFS